LYANKSNLIDVHPPFPSETLLTADTHKFEILEKCGLSAVCRKQLSDLAKLLIFSVKVPNPLNVMKKLHIERLTLLHARSCFYRQYFLSFLSHSHDASA